MEQGRMTFNDRSHRHVRDENLHIEKERSRPPLGQEKAPSVSKTPSRVEGPVVCSILDGHPPSLVSF